MTMAGVLYPSHPGPRQCPHVSTGELGVERYCPVPGGERSASGCVPGGGEARRLRDASVSHRLNLCLELRVALQVELSPALATLPGPGFVFSLRQDDDPAHFFSRNPMQRDRDELPICGHA